MAPMDINAWINLVRGALTQAPVLINDLTALWESVRHLYGPNDQTLVDAELAKTNAVKAAEVATDEANVALDKASRFR